MSSRNDRPDRPNFISSQAPKASVPVATTPGKTSSAGITAISAPAQTSGGVRIPVNQMANVGAYQPRYLDISGGGGGGGTYPRPPGAINGWNIDPAGYGDPTYMNDIQFGAPQAGADWTGYQQNSLASGMGDYAYWLTQQGRPRQGSSGGGGGGNAFAGRMGEFMTNFDKPMPTYTPYDKPMPQYTPFGAAQFEASPGYAFRQSEGQRAVQGSAAARGGFFSGQTGIELNAMGQNIASAEFGNAANLYNSNYQNVFNNWNAGYGLDTANQNAKYRDWENAFNTRNVEQTNQYNRLAAVSGIGQVSANQLGSMGYNAAQLGGQYMSNIGNAQAGGITSAAGYNAAGNSNAMNQVWGAYGAANPNGGFWGRG